MAADDPTLGGLLEPAPKQVDPPGTCHLVGCPSKGVHDPHGVGVPSEGTWRASSQPQRTEGHVVVTQVMADRARVLLEVLAMRGRMDPCHVDEARILARDLRRSLRLDVAAPVRSSE